MPHSNKARVLLLTGGRAPATLALARQLIRQGYRIHMAESATFYLCQASNAIERHHRVPSPRLNPKQYIASLIRICQEAGITALLPTCEEVFYIAHAHAELSLYTTVLCEPLEVLLPLHNKAILMQDLLKEPPPWQNFVHSEEKKENTFQKISEFTVPPTYVLNTASNLAGLLKEQGYLTHPQNTLHELRSPQRWVIKPACSRFAQGQIRFKTPCTPKQLPTWASTTEEQSPYLLQPWLEGTLYCTYGWAFQGKLLSHVVYPSKVVAGQGGTLVFEKVAYPEIDAWVAAFVQQRCFSGQIAFDILCTVEGKAYVLDCNPRLTSGIHLLQSSIPLSHWLGSVTLQSSSQAFLAEPSVAPILYVSIGLWLYGFTSLVNPQQAPFFWKPLVQGQDVVWDTTDVLPFFYQFICLGVLLWQAIYQGNGLLKQSTVDIEWNEASDALL
jgi:hypothetical protein